MKRREFIAGMAIGAVCAPRLSTVDAAKKRFALESPLLDGARDDDTATIKQAVKRVYSVFYVDQDKKKYRSLLTDDYLLLENGEILNIEGDIGLMPSPDSGYKRTDAFDFHSVKVQGNFAYAIYFLKSKITDNKNGARNREWLESAILRRSEKGWLMALLHSTRIVKPAA
ncbi:MAG TPA: nuclear transport factor 2 family protein [Pyrinomonadaceae bacterium]|nr:nuclear transport factor 2 family protein [Pyrinomonadaceae bacterium]